jgi:REP element-mobilizing transposase RayT
MARLPRLEFDGALYHVMVRGNRRACIFHDNADRETFLRRLRRVKSRRDLELYAFALMPNHVHLVVRRRHDELGKFMHALLSPFALFFNRRHGTPGHVFQGRFKSLLCEDETYLLRLIRYVHHNPIRAGLAGDMSYPWTSYAAYLVDEESTLIDTGPILRFFGEDPAAALDCFRSFHEGQGSRIETKDCFPVTKGVLGDEAFASRSFRRAAWSRTDSFPSPPPLDVILGDVLRRSPSGLRSMVSRRRREDGT